jgi:hypothetical protein
VLSFVAGLPGMLPLPKHPFPRCSLDVGECCDAVVKSWGRLLSGKFSQCICFFVVVHCVVARYPLNMAHLSALFECYPFPHLRTDTSGITTSSKATCNERGAVTAPLMPCLQVISSIQKCQTNRNLFYFFKKDDKPVAFVELLQRVCDPRNGSDDRIPGDIL